MRRTRSLLVAGALALVAVPAALAVPIVGTPHDDAITGTDGRDWVYALAGNDTVNGRGGSDFLFGQAGNDTLNGAARTRRRPRLGGRRRLVRGHRGLRRRPRSRGAPTR